jgi:hypothetical protein
MPENIPPPQNTIGPENPIDNPEEKSLVIKKVIFLKKKLDKEIGYNYWKKYVASVFWSQISTPINLTITMLTAVTTAQIQTNDFISPSISGNLAIVSLILATLNTFFRPHTQYATNTEFLAKWRILGVKFEDEYYNNMIEKKQLQDYRKRLESLRLIQKEVNELRQAEGTNTINFLTDFIFFLSFISCLRNKKNWLDRDKAVEEAATAKIEENAREKKATKKSNKRMRDITKQIMDEEEKIGSAGDDENQTEESKPEENKVEEVKPEEIAEVKVSVN